MAKSVFDDTPPQGTILTAAQVNALQNHRHDGLDQDGSAPLDYAVSTGSANAYVLTLPKALTAHIPGLPIRWKANFTNTGAATFNPSGLGAVAMKKNGSTNLVAGDIVSGRIITVSYDGTYYQLLSDTATNEISVHDADAGAHANMQLTVIRAYETQSSGTNASQSSGWNNVPLNAHSKYGPLSSSMSFSAPSITLPAGTYLAFAHSPVETGDNGRAQLRIRDTTASATLCVGGSVRHGTDDDFGDVNLFGMFTLSAEHTITLQRYCSGAGTMLASASGEIEIYGEVLLLKIA